VRPPIWSLTAVREPLAPMGKDWVIPAARSATPMATSSWSTRTCWPWRPAKERAVRISSEKLTKKMPVAAGSSERMSPSRRLGTSMPGRPGGISPTTATPWPASMRAHETAIARTTTTSGPGILGVSQRSPSSRARHATPTATVVALRPAISLRTSTSWGSGSCAAMLSPSSLPSCPQTSTTATPWM
jgi:hypothetical protein